MDYGVVDLHTKHSQVGIVTAQGAMVFERRIVTRADQFATVFWDGTGCGSCSSPAPGCIPGSIA
jgi:hypothetical protein